MSKLIEDTAQEITDLFFEAGGRISKMHFDTVVAKLEERDRIAREEEREKLMNEVDERVKVVIDYEDKNGEGKVDWPKSLQSTFKCMRMKLSLTPNDKDV